MDLERLARRVQITLGVNIALTVVNLGVLYVLLVVVVDEPANVIGQEIPPAQVDDAPQDARTELANFLKRTSDLVDRAARRNGVNPTEYVPTDAEIQAAVASGTIHSEESEAVIQKLREGYDQFGLTWPLVIPRR